MKSPLLFLLILFSLILITSPLASASFGYNKISSNEIKSIVTTITNLNYSNYTEYWITNEGIKDNAVDILGSEITNDLGWAVAGGDTWSLNFTKYYNKTEVDNNFTLYYLLSNPNNYVNITSISNSTIARAGDCPAGQVVMNTTNLGVQCTTPTAVETDSIWTANYTNTFQYLIWNKTYYRTDNSTYANYLTNVSKNWTLETYTNWNTIWSDTSNSTYANILNQNCPTNQVVNGTYINGTFKCIAPTTTESDPIWTANYTIFTGLINNASYLSTSNTTYDTCINNASYLRTDNSSYALNTSSAIQNLINGTSILFNKIFALDWSNVTGVTELDPIWTANFSTFNALIGNLTYSTTYNSTYANYLTNVSKNWTLETYTNWNTIWSATDNSSYLEKSGGTMTGNLNFSAGVNITNPSYIRFREVSGACDLTINHSICANSTGLYITG